MRIVILGAGGFVGRAWHGAPVVAVQLSQSLRVQDRATRDTLGCTPPFATDEELGATCRWFLDQGSPC